MKRRKKGWFALLTISMVLLCFGGCAPSPAEAAGSTAPDASQSVAAASYETISAKEAKKLMDTAQEYTVIDARTAEEFAEGHIENAILMPEYEVAARAPKELPDKDALILVYCRSGRRSKIASASLAALGYTRVKEFGGIIDWPYATVQ